MLPPLERARIYTFLAYNYDDVFGSDGRHAQSFSFWLEMALQEENHSTVTYCALDFITNTLQQQYN